MKKVVKFGGSSLASAKQFKKVGDITVLINPDATLYRLLRANATKMTPK